MAFLPGNFMNASVTAMKLQYRVLLIPWVKRSNCISCGAKARDYSSSLPVKYTPKRFSENEKTEAASLPVSYLRNSSGSFLDAESNNCNACRASDGSGGQNLAMKEDFMDLNDEFIEEPDENVEDSSKKCNGIKSGCTRQDVEKSAVKLLASRAFTALELKKKLQGKRFPLEIINAVITDFQSRGLINDCLYAETYSRSRWASSSWGPGRIRQALFKKGVNGVDTENAVKQVFQNNGGDEDQHTGLAMSKLSIDQLYVQAAKQWHRSRDVSQDTQKSRMVRWLQYRGFNWSVIKLVLKKLESGSSS